MEKEIQDAAIEVGPVNTAIHSKNHMYGAQSMNTIKSMLYVRRTVAFQKQMLRRVENVKKSTNMQETPVG